MRQIWIASLLLIFCATSQANTFQHNPPRLIIGSDFFPWRAFGKLINCPNCKSGCTAFLVSEKHIVTNRHCVFNEDKPTELASNDFYFVRNPMGDDFQAEAFTARLVMDGYAASGTTDTAFDWAILELNYSIGREVGYFGFQSAEAFSIAGFRGSRPEISPLSPFPDPYEELCKDTREPFTDFQKLTNSSVKDTKWFVPPYDIPNAPLLCLGGYPGDVGEMNLVLSDKCTFVGRSGQSYLHDCASTRGSSGSAMFYLDEQAMVKVVSVNRGGYRPGDVSVTNAPINMNNTNIGTEIKTLMFEVERARLNSIGGSVLAPIF